MKSETTTVVKPTIAMQPGALLAEAGRAKMLEQLKKLGKYEPEARQGEVEGVHGMRVATRRLRAGLKVLEETVYARPIVENYRRKLRKLANALGDTRDSDVLLAHLEEYSKGLDGEKVSQIEPLRAVITARREAGRTAMLKELDRKKTSRLLKNLEEFLSKAERDLTSSFGDEYEATPVLVRHFAGSSIWRRYEEVLAYETRLPAASIEILHRLRVACKRLRYTMEFFEEALPVTTDKLIKQIAEVQDYLGRLHDHAVAIEIVERLEKDEPENLVLQEYAAARKGERDKLQRDFETLWLKLSGPKLRRTLALAIAGDSNSKEGEANSSSNKNSALKN